MSSDIQVYLDDLASVHVICVLRNKERDRKSVV